MSLINGGGDADLLYGVPNLDRGIADLVTDLAPMQQAADLPDLFAGLARSVSTALKADAVLVSLLDDSGRILRDVAASVVPPARLNVIAEEYRLDDFPATDEVIRTGRPVEVSAGDPVADPNERGILRSLGFSRLLICRFMVEGHPVGTVEAYRLDDRPFGSDAAGQVDVLCGFAGNAYARIQLAAKLEIHYTETMEALVSALEARDPYTEAHAGRIRDISMALSVALKLPLEERRAIKLGSILHDVGKIGVSDSILLKDGPLSDDEWRAMKAHPEIGEKMLSGIDFLGPALPIVRHHHERWDGAGYPDGLGGDDIPIGARIVSVCDAFDAMTSDRPYRSARPVEVACEEVLKCAGTQFDPHCAELLTDVVTEMGRVEHLEEHFVRYAS
jgi:HD-GYP domain-containing protein (c-di-GMP phosphodiesterase class II)